MTSFFSRTPYLLLGSFLVAATAVAQTNRGSIAGTITDSTGAVVSNANIAVKNDQTGAAYTATTNGVGGYNLPQLELGLYDVTVTSPGFQSTQQKGVSVTIGNVTSLNVALKTGPSSETVTISASAPQVQSQSSDIGTTITERTAVELPLALGSSEMRSPFSFIFTAPGAVGPGTAGQGNFGFNQSGGYQTKLTGGQNFGDEVLVDGASTYRQAAGETFDQLSPSVEALTEFKFEASTLPAEYGRTSGGLTTFNTKSGTNEFHGKAYEIFQNVVLDANNWFDSARLSQCKAGDAVCRSNHQRPLNNENDYGVTLGGPIWVPKVYNGRNKLFFFFSWEQYRKNQGNNIVSTVPTEAFRNGDFSSFLGAPLTGSDGAPLINPCSNQPILAGQIFDPNTTRTVNGTRCRDAFTDNQIPQPRFSAISQKVLGFIPTPNTNPGSGYLNNYTKVDSAPIVQTNWTLRFDWNATEKSRYFFSYTDRYNAAPGTNAAIPGPADPNVNNQYQPTHYFRGGFDHTFSPTLLNHFGAGVTRQVTDQNSPGVVQNFDPQSLGLTGVRGVGFPVFSAGESFINFGQSTLNSQRDSSGQVTDQITMERGRHSINFGVDYRYDMYADEDTAQEPGQFFFGRGQTAAEQGSNLTTLTGNGFASFLLGDVNSAFQRVPAAISLWIQHYGALYFQDNYKAAKNLTLNLGVRWDVDPPRYSRQGRQNNFDPRVINSGVNATGNAGALVFAGSGPGRNGDRTETWADVAMKDFAPRIGFSYSPHDGTAVRGGYGIYYAPLIAADFGNGPNVAGFTAVSSPSSNDGFTPEFKIDDGFPAFPIGVNTDPSQLNFTSAAVNWIQKGDGRPGMVQNWSLQLQQQIAQDLIFSIGYVGQHSTRLNANLRNPNNIPISAFQLGGLLNTPYDQLPAAVQAQYPIPYPTFDQTNVLAQVFRPFPQYRQIGGTGFNPVYQALGQSTYNSLQATLTRQFRQGLHLQLSYTWSKTLTNADSAIPFQGASGTGGNFQNPFDLKGEKALSIQDVPHMFVGSFIYELPVGRGKTFLSGMNRLTDELIGGWQLAGILRYQMGQPLNGPCSNGLPGWDNCIRFNFAGDQRALVNPKARSGHFNPFNGQDRYLIGTLPAAGSNAPVTGTPFTDPNPNTSSSDTAPFQFGNEPKVIAARIPNYYQEDLSVIKKFPVHESINGELRAEMFNAFNRHVFGGPNNDTIYDPNNYGYINGTQDAPRVVQMQLRVNF